MGASFFYSPVKRSAMRNYSFDIFFVFWLLIHKPLLTAVIYLTAITIIYAGVIIFTVLYYQPFAKRTQEYVDWIIVISADTTAARRPTRPWFVAHLLLLSLRYVCLFPVFLHFSPIAVYHASSTGFGTAADMPLLMIAFFLWSVHIWVTYLHVVVWCFVSKQQIPYAWSIL